MRIEGVNARRRYTDVGTTYGKERGTYRGGPTYGGDYMMKNRIDVEGTPHGGYHHRRIGLMDLHAKLAQVLGNT